MKVSLKWLNELIPIKSSVEDLVEKLTDLGLECSFSTLGPSFDKVIIGKVLKVKKHSNSDHLSLCDVDIGHKDSIQIVCGAPNVKNGIYVPVALVGASLDNGNFKIKKTKIRNEESNGMICSEKELDIGEDHSGIMILEDKPIPGTSFKEYLNLEEDVLIDFDLTPNRGDCLSFLGVAREVGILNSEHHDDLTKRVIKDNSFEILRNKNKINNQISVEIENEESCPVYLGQIINDIKVKESPDWLKQKLNSLSMKSINVVVDLANYIMLMVGQPMHVFDFDKLPSKKIKVGYSENKKSIITLDSIERKLSNNNLLIKDGSTPIAIAGVMGGKNTEVDENTKNIFIESAIFDPIVIRKSAKSADLSTDASKRFERSVDSSMAEIALDLLTGLIIKYSEGKASSDIIKLDTSLKNQNKVSFNIDKCNQFLGTNLVKTDIDSIFDKVNIDFKMTKGTYNCIAPSYRLHDIKRDVDIYEEVARVWGYNKIENSSNFSIDYNMINIDNFDLIDTFKTILSNNGFYEHYSNSLISDREQKYFSSNAVMLSNPLNKNMKYVRNSIIPGLLRAVSYNQNRQNRNYKLFEIGAVYDSFENKEFNEKMYLGIAWPFIKYNHWKDTQEYDFFNSKGDLDKILDQFHIPEYDYHEIEKKGFSLCYMIKNRTSDFGYIGYVDLKILKANDIKTNLIYANIDMNKIQKMLSHDTKFIETSVFPSVERDISILVSKEHSSKKLTDTIKKAGGKFLNEVYLFDVYADNSFNKDTNSYAFKMIFQSNISTLKDSEVDLLVEKVIKKLKNNYNITQR